jgi:hypothetical protein
MRRVWVAGVFLCVVVLAASSTSYLAEEKPCCSWETVAPGVQVLKLWEKAKLEWPQVAVLQISNEMYEKIQKNPPAFLNEYKIFPNPVRLQPMRHLMVPLAPPKGYDGAWTIICSHRWDSVSICSGFTMDQPTQAK